MIGNFEFPEWKEFQKNLEKMQQAVPGFYNECLKELAGRLLAKTVARTPVDTSHLRIHWTIGQIQKVGAEYLIEVINPIEYAPYVEFGHRTRDHKGWVEGKFMLTISEKELQSELPAIMERKLQQFINRHLGWGI